MKAKTIKALTLLVLLLISNGIASLGIADTLGVDYPHYQQEGIGCDDCHYTVDETPPPWLTDDPQNIDDTSYNRLCWTCHNGVRAISMNTHSSLTTSNQYGNWAIECRTCHWPHHQKQLRTYGAASYVYSGTVNAVTSNTLTRTGADWTVNQWENYILLPNINNGAYVSYNYRIIGNTADTITVDQNIDLAKVSVGNTFAIFYGKLIKSSLPTPNSGTKTVKFFSREGTNSYADGSSSYDGVCLVCHTQTTHFRNDGSAPDQNHENLGGKEGSNCILCHNHANGFKHGGGGGTGCGTAGTCHGLQGSHPTHMANSEMVLVDCNACHDTSSFPLFKDGQPLATTTACNACHGTGVPQARQYWHDPGSETMTAGSWLEVERDASYCGSCHGGAVEASHNRLNTTAGCADCHDPLDTKVQMIEKHDNSACSLCHVSSDPLLTTTITTGKSLHGNTAVYCANCHTGPDVNAMHGLATTDADVQTKHDMLSVSVNLGNDPADCAICHNLSTVQSRLELHPACLTCHDSADPDVVSAINIGISGTTIYCETCHDAKDQNKLHGLSDATVADVHDKLSVSVNPGVDPVDCALCHLMTTTTDRLDLHPRVSPAMSSCKRCHTSADSDVIAAIANGRTGTTINCETCHDAQGENLMHGLTQGTVTVVHNKFSGSSAGAGEGNCGYCHVTATVADRIDLHVSCTTCHTVHVTDATQRTTVINDGREPDHSVGGGGDTIKYCESCHSALGQYSLHGLTQATVATVHDKFSISTHTAEKDCANCHVMNSPGQRLDLHAACSTCHTLHATDVATRTTVINSGREAGHHVGNGTNAVQYCESCHPAKGTYSLHGLTDDNGADGVLDIHNNLNTAAGKAVTYTGKLAGAYGGLKVATYSCADCHAADRAVITDLEAVRLHTKTSGTGYGDCRTCHTPTTIKNEVDKGREPGHHVGGGDNLTIECEDCHKVAYDAYSPSGQKMYQYDGVRHHTTGWAQSGDCTYCHADPRPATTTKASGYAATADEVGTYDTGWIADYATGTPTPIPKQPACRLCHTNAMSYLVDVEGGSGNHGFNIAGGTADQRTTGLTVWANNYQPAWPTVSSTSSVSITATPVIQTLIHRIEANNTTNLIQAYDLGACFSCHSVQIRHGSPVKGVNYTTDYDANNHTPYDVLRYAPGRSIFGNGYDLKGDYSPTEDWKDHDREKEWCKNRNCESRGKNWLKKVYGDDSGYPKSWGSGVDGDILLEVPGHSAFDNFKAWTGIPVNGTMNTDSDIYYFADIASPPVVDTIHISRAYYSGTLVVEAYSAIGAGQSFSFTYTGGGCGTIAMTWDGAKYTGTCDLPSGWTEGVDTVTVSNTTTASPLDVETSLVDGYKSITAVNDFAVVNPSAVTPVAVMVNDIGEGLYLFSLNTAGLNGNCSAAVNGANVNLTCGAVLGDMGSFDYTIKDSQGDPDTATVTVTVDPKATLSISQPDGTYDDIVQSGQSYSITYSLADVDDAVTAAFYYDTDNADLDGIAIAGACAAAAEGTNVTCSWNTTNVPAGSYYVYGVSNDGLNQPVSAYSSGKITIAAPPEIANLVPLSGTETVNSGLDYGEFLYEIGNGTDRLLIVTISAVENDYSATGNNMSATYGDKGLTQIVDTTVSGRIGMWMGYLLESDIENRKNNTLVYNNGNSSYDQTQVQVMAFVGVNQTTPISDYYIDQTYVSNTGSSTVTKSFTWNQYDMPIYSAASRSVTTHSTPADFTRKFYVSATSSQSSGYKTDVKTGSGSGTIGVAFGVSNNQCALIGAILKAAYTPAVANNDTLDAWTNRTTSLPVLANDTGAGISVVALNNTALNANCSTAINGSDVDVTCGNGYAGATAFDYTIMDNKGGMDTATVTLNVSVNDSPAISISQPDGAGDAVDSGQTYNITYTLSDAEEAVTAAFYYDTDAVGLNGTAITGACAAAAEGTAVTCSWDTTGMAPGDYYVYGLTSDGINPQESAYSPGQITINCPSTSILNTWTSVYGDDGVTPSGSKTISAGTGTNRLLVVAVLNENSSDVANTWNVTYGGQALTPITSVNNGRANMWLGYLKESGIDAAGNTTVIVNMTGSKDYTQVYAIALDNVNQTTPVAGSSPGYNSSYSGTSVSTGNITWAAKDQMIYAADSNSTSDHTPPGTYTEVIQNLYTLGASAGRRTSTAGGGTEAISVTHGSGRSSIIGAAIKAMCN